MGGKDLGDLRRQQFHVSDFLYSTPINAFSKPSQWGCTEHALHCFQGTPPPPSYMLQFNCIVHGDGYDYRLCAAQAAQWKQFPYY
jgi:hypothetical protein